jgi:polar amino acid transport system substrate-binding protein
MTKLCRCLLVTLFFGPLHGAASDLDRLTFITENYPPYNYLEKGELKGSSVGILKAMLHHSGIKPGAAEIRVLPWARGYDTTLLTPDTVLFSTTRTSAREDLFQWVGPLAAGRVVLLAKKDSHISIANLEALQNGKFSMVVIGEDIGAQKLLESGVSPARMHTAVNNESAMNMLVANRVSLWAYGEDVAHWLLRKYGHDPDDFETVYVLSEDPLYFAVNGDTDPAVVERLQQILDDLRALGKIPPLE